MLSRRFVLSLICLSVEIVVGINASCISEDLIRTLMATKGSCKNDIKQENIDKPAFFAFLKSDLTSSGRQVIKFQDVRINKGNHYNPTTGIFTAPRQGIYQISCTIVGYTTHVFWYQITVNSGPYTLVEIINSLPSSPKRRQLPVIQQDNESRKITVSKNTESLEKAVSKNSELLNKVNSKKSGSVENLVNKTDESLEKVMKKNTELSEKLVHKKVELPTKVVKPVIPKKPAIEIKLNLDEFKSSNQTINIMEMDDHLDLDDFESAKHLFDSGAKIDLDNLDSDRQSSHSSHHDDKAINKDKKETKPVISSLKSESQRGKVRKHNKLHFGVKDGKLVRNTMSPILEDPSKLVKEQLRISSSKTSNKKDSKESESKEKLKSDSLNERLSRADKPADQKRSNSVKVKRSSSASRLDRTTKDLEDVKDKLSSLSPNPPDADRLPKPPPGHAPKNAAVLARRRRYKMASTNTSPREPSSPRAQ